jgi:hypothetical protein
MAVRRQKNESIVEVRGLMIQAIPNYDAES